jgi:peroxiredoxin
VVAQVARRYEGEVAVVGIGSRDSMDRLQGFVDRHGLTGFPHAADESGDLRARLGVLGQPTWIFVAADGTTEKVFGPLGEDGLVERFEELTA